MGCLYFQIQVHPKTVEPPRTELPWKQVSAKVRVSKRYPISSWFATQLSGLIGAVRMDIDPPTYYTSYTEFDCFPHELSNLYSIGSIRLSEGLIPFSLPPSKFNMISHLNFSLGIEPGIRIFF